jgi:hypothetical protein
MRKLLIGLLAVGLVLFGAVFALLRPRPCPVNRAAYERIEEGMTLADVEAILGGPPGDYQTRPSVHYPHIGALEVCPEESWEGDELPVQVYFDGGVVCRKSHRDKFTLDTGPLELILWRLERLKERCFP